MALQMEQALPHVGLGIPGPRHSQGREGTVSYKEGLWLLTCDYLSLTYWGGNKEFVDAILRILRALFD